MRSTFSGIVSVSEIQKKQTIFTKNTVCLLYTSWVFDGIGSTIFSLIVGALIGGAIGYKIGIHKNVKQKQIGGNSAKQRQEFTCLLYTSQTLDLHPLDAGLASPNEKAYGSITFFCNVHL